MSPAKEFLAQPGGLAEQLYGMREAAGLRAGELAARLGWASSSKVTKIQRGDQLPSPEEIRAWAAECGRPDKIGELLNLHAQAVTASHRQQQRRKHPASLQENQDTLTRAARRIRSVQVAVMPGLLQTADYAERMTIMFRKLIGDSLDRLDETVAARMHRQDVLYEPGREFEFAITENVLRRDVGGAQAMLRQLDRLATLAGLDNITIGIIPDNAEGLDFIPFQGYQMFDNTVLIESMSADDKPFPDDAGTCALMAGECMAAAAKGDDAQRIIATAARYWREKLDHAREP